MTCDRFQAAVVAADDVGADLERHEALAEHAASCVDCRAWAAAYAEGAAWWVNGSAGRLAPDVIAATAGDVCALTRQRLTSATDSPPDASAATLVAGHLGRCEGCRAFAAAWSQVSLALPGLADLDPGLGFTAAVLARTSRRRPASWLDRVRAVGTRLARRPRFAWEAAYVVTLIWLVVFGPPVAVLDWTTARVGAVTADAVPDGMRDAGSQVLARVETLQQRWTGQVEKASAAVDTGGMAAGHYVQDARDVAARWWERGLAGLADLLSSSWVAIVDWLDRAFGGEAGGEPSAPPARSGQ